MNHANKEFIYDFLFQGNPEIAKKAKSILEKLKKGCVSDDDFVKDFTKGETDVTLYKMRRHEYHSLIYHLQKVGLIEKRKELWCLDKSFLNVLEGMLKEIAELHNLNVNIRYSEM